MKEIWRSVKDYEGLYEVSNFGRVRSLPRMTPAGMRGGKIMKPVMNTWGYLHLLFSKDGKAKHHSIHRLVAEAFIDNPDNLPIVNHKDEVKTNNFVFIREDGSVDFNKSNLEWCDCKYSADYGTRTERMAKAKSKTVLQFTLSGEFVREWSSPSEVERQTGWSQGNISNCCNGHRRYTHAYGYVWRYKEKTASEQSEAVSG